MRCSNLTGSAPGPVRGGGLSGAPCGPKQEPGTVPAPAGAGGGGRPQQRPQRALPGAGVFFSTGGGRRALPCSSGIWPCRQPLGRMNGVPPCACWRRIILPWRWRERRNGGFSGRLARHPISGSPGWTWRTWPTTKRTGTVCFGPQAGPWPSPSGPEPTSVRRPPGESIPGTWPAWGTFTQGSTKGAGGGPESAGPGAG